MSLVPYSDRVIVRKILLETKSAGGIILSANEVQDNKEVSWGRVLAVGKGKQVDSGGPLPMYTEVGDIVGFNDKMPARFHYKGEYLYLIRETDIMINNKDKDVTEKAYEEMRLESRGPQYLG